MKKESVMKKLKQILCALIVVGYFYENSFQLYHIWSANVVKK